VAAQIKDHRALQQSASQGSLESKLPLHPRAASGGDCRASDRDSPPAAGEVSPVAKVLAQSAWTSAHGFSQVLAPVAAVACLGPGRWRSVSLLNALWSKRRNVGLEQAPSGGGLWGPANDTQNVRQTPIAPGALPSAQNRVAFTVLGQPFKSLDGSITDQHGSYRSLSHMVTAGGSADRIVHSPAARRFTFVHVLVAAGSDRGKRFGR